ncbi:hypothetical protein [Streptomyces pseudogriseolus]|uniref:hypothetical protein n=1 Tax=Streptomyces pseudogriseolus TaxID=36817 RepID=UPI003FA1C816
MMHRPTGPACGNNPNHRVTDGDRQAVEDFKAYLEQRADGRGDIVRYRKKPVEVFTMQWTGDNEQALQAFTGGPDFFHALTEDDRTANGDDPAATAAVYDKLHSTWVLVCTGQHIVRGVKGEYYPIAEAVLAETYEPVSSAGQAPATNHTTDEVDADTVANRAAQVITTMGAEIRELKHSRDRYRTAWLSARQRVVRRRLADETPDTQTQDAPGGTGPRPCRTFVSGGPVWCCEEGETHCPCTCHQPTAGARDDQCAWCGAPLHDETEEWVTLTIRSEEWALCRRCGESPDTMARLIRHITHNDEQQPAAARQEATAPAEVVHGCPPVGSGLTPCCGRTPSELPRTDRISSEAPITCTGPAAGARQDGAQT